MAITYLSGGRIQGSSAAAGTESDYSQDTGSNDGTGFGNNNVLGNRIGSGNSLIGKTATKAKFYLKKTSSAVTGTMSGVVYRGDFDGGTPVKVHTFETKTLPDDLPNTDMALITFEGSSFEIQENDGIAVECNFTGGNSGVNIRVSTSYSNEAWRHIEYNAVAWSLKTGIAARMIVTAMTPIDEKTTISNVPVGTRFEETDTRKIYRRGSAGTFTSTDYTTSNFTAVGSTVAITSNSAVSSSTPANTANRVYATIPSLTSTDAWSCDFQLFITADGTYDYNSIAFCTNSDAFNTSGQNQISVQTQGGGYQRFVLYARIGGSNSESTTSNSSRALNTDYYCTLSSDGANTARLRIWTNSNRTGTPAQDETLSIASIGTLTTVMHGVRNSGDSNVWSGTVSNVSLTNPASWKEKGTAL